MKILYETSGNDSISNNPPGKDNYLQGFRGISSTSCSPHTINKKKGSNLHHLVQMLYML